MAEWDTKLRELISRRTATYPALCCLDVVDSRTVAAFIQDYAGASRPVIIRGIMAGSAVEKWTPSLLIERFGALRISVRGGNYVTDAFTADREDSETSLADYIASISRAADGMLPIYAGNNPLQGDLLSDVCFPPFFQRAEYDAPRMWLGPAGTITPLHSDLSDNFLCQVFGEKKVVLFPPHQEAMLYTIEINPKLHASKVDVISPNLELHPQFVLATATHCTISAGDTLFLPAGWFHHVTSISMSLSINFFVHRVPEAARSAIREAL
jgi:hypothetical protein